MLKQPTQYIDAVMGSSDLFLYDTERIILSIDTERSSFCWLSLDACRERLNRVPPETFRDSLLLLGGPYLPIFPALDRMGLKSAGPKDALNLLNSAGRSVVQLCNTYREDPQMQSTDYADRYKKAIVTIRHHVIMDTEGVVAPMQVERAPGNIHDFIGQRLPEELYFYISRGLISPRVPNWLTSGAINLSLQPGVEDSEYFHRLMGDQLVPLWTQSLVLLANSLTRYYQVRSVEVRPWFSAGRIINLKDEPSIKDQISSWKIRESALPEILGSNSAFSTYLTGLEDSKFVAQTTTKPEGGTVLKSQNEILANVFFRFLQLRGYIDSSHKLTKWGKALQAAFAASDPKDHPEETILLGVEMLRLGLINDKDMFITASGAPGRGTGKHELHTIYDLGLCKMYLAVCHRQEGYRADAYNR